MSEDLDSEFLDARPETARQPKVLEAATEAAAADALADMADADPEEEDDDDLIFLDAAADSGLDIQVIAPGKEPETRRGSRAAPARSQGAPALPDTKSAQKRPSGVNKRTTSGRNRISGMHRVSSGGLSPLAGRQEEWAQRARTPAEQAAVLTELHESAQRTIPGDPYIGADLGPFRVEKFIRAERGMRVYVGLETDSQERALLRVFPLKGGYAAEFKALVDRGERACRVQSPAMAVCVAAGRTKECFFTGHELPMGKTLAELLASGESFEEKDVLTILKQVSAGLKVLHARQLVHGDVCLETIRRERNDLYVLEGAGLGRSRPEFSFLAAGGEVVGSPGFIAPELVDSGQGATASDIYALGCLAWALLAGRPPFSGTDQVQVLLDQLNNEVPRLSDVEGVKVSEATAAIVRKLTGYTPNVRYASVSDLAGDLRSREKGESIKPIASDLKKAHTEPEAPQKISAGNLLWVLLLLIDVALAVAVVGTWLNIKETRLEDPIPGYELPLPGVSDGGYRRPTRDKKPQPPKNGETPNH